MELIWLYFPLRWCTWGCTLLFIPEGSSMDLVDMSRAWTNGYNIVSRIADQRHPEVVKVALMANLP